MIIHQTSLSILTDFLEIIQAKHSMCINLPSYSTYMQSFNFRSLVLPQTLFDKKALLTITQSAMHPPIQLAQFHTPEPQMCSRIFWRGGRGPRTNRLDFGSNWDHDPDSRFLDADTSCFITEWSWFLDVDPTCFITECFVPGRRSNVFYNWVFCG